MASSPYLSQITIFGFNFPPRGWATCDGQLLPINQNQALFALLGTIYGGDGRVNFALPDLRGRVPVHTGQAPGGSSFTQGERSGIENHTLTVQEMPVHNHSVMASSAVVSQVQPGGNVWGKDAQAQSYHNTGGAQMGAGAISNTGSSQSHNNMAPYLVLNICIALQGIFPSRN